MYELEQLIHFTISKLLTKKTAAKIPLLATDDLFINDELKLFRTHPTIFMLKLHLHRAPYKLFDYIFRMVFRHCRLTAGHGVFVYI